MHQELSLKTAVCPEYERLMHECQRALQIWQRRRDHVAEEHWTGKQVGDELQKLQANYAKAYACVDLHNKECELCRFAARIAGHQLAGSSDNLPDKSQMP